MLGGAAVVAALVVAVPTVVHVTSPRSADLGGIGVLRRGLPPVDSRTNSFDQDQAAERLLVGMSAAAVSGDEGAFLRAAAPVGPAARDRLRVLFRNLRALPLATITFARDLNRTFGVSAGTGGAITLPVTATYRLKRWDSAPVQVALQFVVAPSGGALGVVEERTVADGAAERLEPWLFADLAVVTKPHVLVLGERRNSARVQRLATTLERLVADVRRVWPERTWNARVVVYAMTDTAFVRSWYGRTAAGDEGNDDKASFVAKVATLSLAGDDQRSRTSAVRMVVTPYLLEQAEPTEYVEILRHEMTHVATAGLTPGLPAWLVEGAADYTGYTRRTRAGALDVPATFARRSRAAASLASMQRGTWRPRLARGADLYRGSEDAVDGAYDSAFVTCLYIADRYGESALRRLYERAGQIAWQNRLQPQVTAITEEAALRTVLRTDRKRLIKQVAAFATRLRRHPAVR